MAKISDLGNGLGFIYWVETDGVTVIETFPNDCGGLISTISDAVSRAPIGGDLSGTGGVTVTVIDPEPSSTVTSFTVNGVEIIGSTVNLVGGDKEASIRALRDEVNSYVPVSGPRYRATANGDQLILHAPAGDTSVNGHVVAITPTGATTFSTENIDGASRGNEIYDVDCGRRYFYDADFGPQDCSGSGAAIKDDISNAREITKHIIMRGLQNRLHEEDNNVGSVNTGVLDYARVESIQHVIANLPGSGSANLGTINPSEYVIGDIIILTGASSSKAVTVEHDNGNIKLNDGVNLVLGDQSETLLLRLTETSSSFEWVEIGRSSLLTTSRLSYRSTVEEAIPKIGTAEVDLSSIVQPYTKTLVPGTDKQVLRLKNSVTLTANLNIVFDTGSAYDQDTFYVIQEGSIDVDSFDLIIGGVTINSKIASAGKMIYKAVYSSALGNYKLYGITDFTGGGKILGSNIASDEIGTSHIKDDAITQSKMADNSVGTNELNSSSVIVDKLDSNLRTEVIPVIVTCESGEQGTYEFKIPYKCDVIEVQSRTFSAVAASDNWTIQMANASGNMTDGLITHVAGAAFGDVQTVTPSSNQEILAGETIKATSTKSTAGGKTILMIKVQRKP